MAAYRWMWRTIWPNLRWYWICFRYGVRNIYTFWTTVWNFDACDYSGLLKLIEVSAREMRNLHRYHGHTVSAQRIDRQLTIVTELCRRLWEDEYFPNAGYVDDKWNALPHHRQMQIINHSRYMARQDAEYLGKMFRFIQWWWD